MNASSSNPFPSSEPPGVLIVDDESAIRDLARLALEAEGYRVFDAGTAKEAIKLVEAFGAQIHVVVTDVMMPGADGLTLARQVRKRAPLVQIIVVSAHLSQDHYWPEDLRDLRFLPKPFSLAALTRAAGEAMVRFHARSRAP